MKNYYFILLAIAFFGLNTVQAQFCPPTGYATPDTLYFIYDSGTSDCADRPTSVTCEGSVFNQIVCYDELSIYALATGSPLTDPNNIAVDFGFAICTYSDGILSAKEFEMILKSMLNVHPNPVNHGDILNVELGINTSVKVDIFNITGKKLLSTDRSSLNKIDIDISSLENGIYLAQIVTDMATITKKVIIMK